MKTRIKELRLSKYPRITQQELANELGLSKSVICQYENGSKNPSSDVLIKLTKAFTKLLERQITINDIIPH